MWARKANVNSIKRRMGLREQLGGGGGGGGRFLPEYLLPRPACCSTLPASYA